MQLCRKMNMLSENSIMLNYVLFLYAYGKIVRCNYINYTCEKTLNNTICIKQHFGGRIFSLSIMEWLWQVFICLLIPLLSPYCLHAQQQALQQNETQRRRGKKWRGTTCTFRGVPDSSFVRPDFTPTFGVYKKTTTTTKHLTNSFLINSYFCFQSSITRKPRNKTKAIFIFLS